MTPLAARSPLAVRLMTRVMRRQLARRFHAVRLAAPPSVDPGDAVVVVSNHPSWWDPAVFILLHTMFFAEREGYGPMEAEALGRYGVLARIGIFGLPPGRAGARRFLEAGDAILRARRTVLWVTAEGTFSDVRRAPVLRPGVAHLLRGRTGVTVLPLALEYPFWNESTPEALARFGPPLSADPARSVDDWQAALTGTLSATMAHLAEDAIARDPGRFATLLGGHVGIGGPYDLWRRLRALLRGETARLEHGP
jgi:1-acyl-sn-glycerol-3-phosphate acyltransferase